MSLSHAHFIKPKDLLSQIFWYSDYNSCSREEAIHHMSYIRELKQWLMSGNPMRVEDCLAKCQGWSKRFPVKWDTTADDTFSVSMQYVSFTYSWDNREA